MISALGALALARGMVRPIRTLDEGARRIGAGDLDQKIDVRTGDELEALADQFNRMTAQLRESYAGLERKVDERTRELTNSLEQQTAISEILRVISSSPTDVQPVLDAVAERAAHLCGAPFARVMLIDGDVLRPVADYSAASRGAAAAGPAGAARPHVDHRRAPRSIATTIHLADIVPLLDAEYPGRAREHRRFGCRAVLAVPLMREGGAYGGIFLFRREPGLFSPDQVALVETFARQAAIAIDNVRLFNETKEALEQQTAISEILRVISSSPTDVQPVLDAVAERALKLCDAAESAIVLVEGRRAPLRRGDSAARRTPAKASSMPLDPRLGHRARGRRSRAGPRAGPRCGAGRRIPGSAARCRGGSATARSSSVPLMREGRAIGAIALWRMEARAFTDKQIALLKTFADQAVIAIENVRLFNETKEALEQQRASGEVLACDQQLDRRHDAGVRRDPRELRAAVRRQAVGDQPGRRRRADPASAPTTVPAARTCEQLFPAPIDENAGSGAAILRRRSLHFPDVERGGGGARRR